MDNSWTFYLYWIYKVIYALNHDLVAKNFKRFWFEIILHKLVNLTFSLQKIV